jgi:hypothetical protein
MLTRSEIQSLLGVPLSLGLILIGIAVASKNHAFIKLGAMVGGPLIMVGLIGMLLAQRASQGRDH